MQKVEENVEAIEVLIYDLDSAIELLDDIKEELKALKKGFKQISFVRISGYLNPHTGEKRFHTNAKSLVP